MIDAIINVAWGMIVAAFKVWAWTAAIGAGLLAGFYTIFLMLQAFIWAWA